MDWMYLFYFLLGTLAFFGARLAGWGEWNEDYTSREQTKVLQGIMALGVALHHMAQKTCGSWHPHMYTVHGLDPFLSIGYLLVGVFLFCSGLGLYRSYKSKPDYLRGFCRRRILPIVIAFYLSEVIYTALRLAMGEKMDAVTVLWYLSGLHMANFNAWYAIVIPFFYLAFWAAFRFCRREGTAIFAVFLFALGYTAVGARIGHQDDWWMRGEWWYNSIALFPLGLLFGRYEKRVTAVLKKGYWLWLPLAFAAAVLLFRQSEWRNNHGWGYYGALGDPLAVAHRLMSAGLQWLAAAAFAAACFLLMLKVKLGNRALAWLGSVTLEFYLMHGMFVELFGFNFLDTARSLRYIRNLPLYIAAVLACSVPATILFSLVWKRIVGLTRRKDRDIPDLSPKPNAALAGLWRGTHGRTGAKDAFRRFFVPGAAALILLLYFMLPSFLGGDKNVRVMNGMEFHIPEGYSRTYSESRYAVWEYKGEGGRPGNLILDADIRDGKARNLGTAEEVLEECDWMAEAELYVNPQGVRMVRGFADYSGNPERRYYIESAGNVLLMCMIEDERYYSRDDCEAAMLRTADSVRPVK